MPEATAHRLNELEVDMRRVKTDLYYGDGEENRPMTVRVANLEDTLGKILADGKATRQMMAGTILTVVSGVVIAFVCYKLGIRI